MSSPLKITNLNKSFGPKHVLNNISFSLEKGEIFGLIGLNGAGKTTLIKIILNLLFADSGEASFFEYPITTPFSRQNIAYLPEKFQPSQFLRGAEFLSLAQSYYHKKYDKALAEKLSIQLGLDPKMLHEKITDFSKGMGQMLGLLSVFMSQAELLILDEPMSGLDPSARIELKHLLLDYIKQEKTVFFSSHILADIDEICKRIGVIHNGSLVFVGTPSEFKNKYNQTNLEQAFLKSITGLK